MACMQTGMVFGGPNIITVNISKLYQKLQNISVQIFPVVIYILTKFDPL